MSANAYNDGLTSIYRRLWVGKSWCGIVDFIALQLKVAGFNWSPSLHKRKFRQLIDDFEKCLKCFDFITVEPMERNTLLWTFGWPYNAPWISNAWMLRNTFMWHTLNYSGVIERDFEVHLVNLFLWCYQLYAPNKLSPSNFGLFPMNET